MPNHVLYDVTYPDKAIDLNSRLLYESVNAKNKITARIICEQTLNLMGTSSNGFNPATYQIPILQPVGSKYDKSQVNMGFLPELYHAGSKGSSVTFLRSKTEEGYETNQKGTLEK